MNFKSKLFPIFTGLLLLFSVQSLADAAGNTEKPVLQQNAPDGKDYFSNRRALVGRGCEVNKLVNTVDVGSWTTGLSNLVNEDLSDFAIIPKIVSLNAGVAPIVSIRDMEHHYEEGTKAGFVIVASSDASLLTLDIVKGFAIQFYCEGNMVGTAVPVEEGKDITALGLSLISIPGDKDVTIELSAKAPGRFDEICLMPYGGVDLSAVTNMQVKYGFVGEPKQYNLINGDGVGDINDYCKDYDGL